MILWSELENYFEESVKKDQNLEIQLLFNKCKITSFLDYNHFVYTTSIDILELQKDKYSIIDKTIESKQVKSPTRFLQVLLKKEVFE
jgi:hypothetical protein